MRCLSSRVGMFVSRDIDAVSTTIKKQLTRVCEGEENSDEGNHFEKRGNGTKSVSLLSASLQEWRTEAGSK